MSRLFNKFIEEVMQGNPYLYNEMLEMQLDAEYKEFHHIRDEWINGIRTTETHSIKEWEWAGRPKRKCKS